MLSNNATFEEVVNALETLNEKIDVNISNIKFKLKDKNIDVENKTLTQLVDDINNITKTIEPNWYGLNTCFSATTNDKTAREYASYYAFLNSHDIWFYRIDKFAKYNIKDNTVENIESPHPNSLYQVGYFMMDKKLYLFGGSTSTTGTTEQVCTYIYDIETGQWESKADHPVGTRHSVCGCIDNNIYVISPKTADNYMYNPTLDTWTLKTPLTSKYDYTYNLKGLALNEKIYAIGNVGLQEYSPITNSWTKYTMDTPRYEFGITSIDNKIYCLGGYSSTTSYKKVINVYDTYTRIWTTKANLTKARDKATSIAVDNCIYTFSTDGTFDLYLID